MCGKIETAKNRTRRQVIIDTIRNYGGDATIGDLQWAVDNQATQRVNAAYNVPAASVRRDIQTLRNEGYNIQMNRRGTYITYTLVD